MRHFRAGAPSTSRPERHLEALAPEHLKVTVAGHRAEFLYWGFFDTTPWRNYLHTHSFFEVCYAYGGGGTFRIGEDVHPVRPGDVHEVVSADDDPLGIVFWAYTLVRDRSAADEADRSLLEAFAAPNAPVLARRTDHVPELVRLLADEARRRRPGHRPVASALAAALLVETARGVVDPDAVRIASTAAPREVTVDTMTRYLRDNYHRPVTVRDVAAQVHMSERHAARLFRQRTGTSIHAYLATLRLEIAAQRLLEHGSSIKEVAHSCGYPDVRHFTTAFRRRWGTTPASFRDHNGTTFLREPPDSRWGAPR